jgi:FtsP/CotA-like multicopper oxidase with cupredoxin domain
MLHVSSTGDHFVVNGVIWPKYIIEQTGWQRIRLLNGCDSRFLVINFVLVADQTITGITGAEGTVPYHVIGTDQGLVFEGAGVSRTDDLVIAPGNRYDIVINFPESMKGKRVIVTNNGGDAPFRGLPAEVFTFPLMKTTMAFDIGSSKPPKRTNPPKNMMMMDNKKAPKRILRSKLGPKDEPLWGKINDKGSDNRNTCSKDANQGTARVRRVALFEGTDEYGRLQPLLGTAEPATDFEGKDINWPEEDPYNNNGLTGSIEGTAAWHTKTTENPALGSCEEWEICEYSEGCCRKRVVFFSITFIHVE